LYPPKQQKLLKNDRSKATLTGMIQKQELPVAAMFDNGLGQNEQSL
jgi:hypothetical protein